MLLTLLFVACGPGSDRCAIDGRFLKMNQGEFRVYSPLGHVVGIDTIKVAGGRFEKVFDCYGEELVVIVLPNFYELPVFMQPGKTIKLRADATHIRDIEITGTDANEQMTEWRKQNNDLSSSEKEKKAEEFIRKNPTSLVSQWMLYKYFLCSEQPDYSKINTLATIINVAVAKTGGQSGTWIADLMSGSTLAKTLQKGGRLPSFSATDIYGKSVSSASYLKNYAVITVMSTNNYDSQSLNRQIKRIFKYEGKPSYEADAAKETGNLKSVLTISLDASPEETKQTQHRDSMPWHIVCDGMMFESPLAKKLGITRVPDNILLKDGKVIARSLKFEDLERMIRTNK